jgi:hypothetical protein
MRDKRENGKDQSAVLTARTLTCNGTTNRTQYNVMNIIAHEAPSACFKSI